MARRRPYNLRAVVEVVPVVAGADPVVVGGSVVGLVVGVSGGVVELAGLGVLAGGLGVEGGGGLTVENLEHLQSAAAQISKSRCANHAQARMLLRVQNYGERVSERDGQRAQCVSRDEQSP